jgi:4-amino-4-deoxy-L-arabinose transferase-like glycosyltransferase
MRRRTHLAIALSILAIAVRLILINQPYIDNWSWRQSDVAAIARNFYTNGFQFTHPQIDWAGDQPGYIGTEFPILPFAAAICYKFLGVHDWIGRIQGVILFAASLPFFFLFVREIFGEIAAVWAIVFYGFAPLNVFTSREFMPDVPSLSLGIIGLYFFLRWTDSEEAKYSVAAALAILLSILIKLPSVLVGVPLACLAWQKWGWKFLRQPAPWFFAAATLLPSAIWYWHAHEIASKFYPHHFFGAGGVRIENLSWYGKIAKQIVISTLTPPLFVLAMVGILVARLTTRARIFRWWLTAMILFIIVVGYGSRHQWYQLPIVPIAAALAGASCAFVASKISERYAKVTLSILFAVAFAVFAFVRVRPAYGSRSSAALRDLGLELNRVTPANALIVAADNGDPTVFYYAERKGWHLLEKEGIYEGEPMESAQAILNLDKLRKRGATHLVFTFNTAWWLDYYREFGQHVDATATLLRATPEFRIYKLDPQAE